MMKPMRWIVALALAGCTDDSPQAHLDDMKAASATSCWTFNECAYGSTYLGSLPDVPVEQGVSCMNDALASGTRAMAQWSYPDFGRDITYGWYVFTVDHHVKVFTSRKMPYTPADVVEEPACTGPFRVDDQALCGVIVNGIAMSVYALAWDGCP